MAPLQSIIEIALQQGIWAALYIYRRMPKENAERETQYDASNGRTRDNDINSMVLAPPPLDGMPHIHAAGSSTEFS